MSLVVFATMAPLAAPGSDDYVTLVLTLALMVGLLQLAMGIARLGALVNFISHTVVVGFTSGAGSSSLPHSSRISSACRCPRVGILRDGGRFLQRVTRSTRGSRSPGSRRSPSRSSASDSSAGSPT
jgi:hypothetical protein